VTFGFELVHLWATALWFSVVMFFLAGWRGLGTDVARFRAVRWIGGLLLAVSIATGLGRAAPLAPTPGDLATGRYGQVLAVKIVVILAVVALGGAAVLGRGGANAVQASRFFGAQGLGAGAAALLAAYLALLAPPGTATPATLAGVALGDVVPLDQGAFGSGRGMLHLLTQPVTPGAQTVVAQLTTTSGAPLAPATPPLVEMTVMPLESNAQPSEPVALSGDASGTLFTGGTTLAAGWRQIDVAITPPEGVVSRAQFWLVVPDPNVAGTGPSGPSDAEAMALYERGLASLTALQSVRFTQRSRDGGGSFSQAEVAVSASEGERPAAFAESIIAANGEVEAQQTIVGNRRWRLVNGAWSAAEPIPFQVPAAWGEHYAGAEAFQLGPREAVGGELSQVVTFWVPALDDPARAPAWFAWWVGLASGQVRREAMISTRQYTVSEYRDFNAELGIEPPVVEGTPVA
jgi:hypothetical protein